MIKSDKSDKSEILRDPHATKSTAFTREERDEHGLRGLLPYAVTDLERQKSRALENMRRKHYDIERYIFLTALQDRNETLFYRTLIDNIEEIMPLIYTPTVGQACREFAHIFRRPRGFYVTPEDKGQMRAMLDNWPEDDVRVIVVTDGERILGLGDLGANGMGISIGKLSLYTACAGIHPNQCLPVMLDIGTNNDEIRNDPSYLGYPAERVKGDAYLELVDEFMAAAQDKYPDVLIQFEDFLTPNAYSLLNRHRDQYLCFNDDIQGTAAVSLAGVMAATRATGKAFKDLKIMFLGAGSAATGIGDLMARAFEAEGLNSEEARRRLWFVDVEGLVVAERSDLAPQNLPYAHDHPKMGFMAALDSIKPDILIGATGAPGTFNEGVVRKMAELNEKPVIFALSNPTSRAECTAEEAYKWSDGRVIFSSGSPFKPVVLPDGSVRRPGQGNNAYVFPGIGLGALAAKASTLPDEVFLTAAAALAGFVSENDLAQGALYPKLSEIRRVSEAIAFAVADKAFSLGIAGTDRPDDLAATIAASMYDPHY
ncbi:MAG: NAD-dependent malic enzyme [Hyphomicrobiales bacterium]